MVKTLFQASTWNALALGNFDTVISVRELLRCADTGGRHRHSVGRRDNF